MNKIELNPIITSSHYMRVQIDLNRTEGCISKNIKVKTKKGKTQQNSFSPSTIKSRSFHNKLHIFTLTRPVVTLVESSK